MEGYYTGRISSVDKNKGYVKVVIPRENNSVTNWLPLLSSEYDMPKPEEFVAVIINENLDGICLGKIFSNSQPPAADEGYYKEIDGVKIRKTPKTGFEIAFDDGAFIRYKDKTLTLSADKILLNGYRYS